jgi:hypothetical protein
MKITPHLRLAVGLILAGIFSYEFALHHTLRHVYLPNQKEFSLEAACAGTAAPPFCYRVLVPWIVNVLSQMVPASVGIPSPWEFMFLIDIAGTFALVLALWIWLREWSADLLPRVIGMLLAAEALIITYVAPTKLSHYYWYDIPAVLFFTLGLLAIERKRLVLFYALFVFATLNKETTCFLSLALLLLWWEERPARAIFHVTIQAFLWLLIKAGLCYIDGQGPRSTFWWTFPRNLQILSSYSDMRVLCSAVGFIPILTLASWRLVQNRNARLLALVSVPFGLGMFLVGWLEEIRIYGELLPLLLPASILGIQRVLRWRPDQSARHRHLTSA